MVYCESLQAFDKWRLLLSDGVWREDGKILNYRIDRMKDVELIGEAQSGVEEFKTLDMESYLNEHFCLALRSWKQGKDCFTGERKGRFQSLHIQDTAV